MNKIKKVSSFLWNELYNKRAFLALNLYNFVGTMWYMYLSIAGMNCTEDALPYAFLMLWTMYLNVIVYIICHIAFVIQRKKNRVMKDNPVIKSWVYRVICILGFFIVWFNYLFVFGFTLYYLSGQIF